MRVSIWPIQETVQEKGHHSTTYYALYFATKQCCRKNEYNIARYGLVHDGTSGVHLILEQCTVVYNLCTKPCAFQVVWCQTLRALLWKHVKIMARVAMGFDGMCALYFSTHPMRNWAHGIKSEYFCDYSNESEGYLFTARMKMVLGPSLSHEISSSSKRNSHG